MKKSLLASTVALFALITPANAQSPQEHQQHHPGRAGTTAQAPASTPAPAPAPAQPQQGQMSMGQMMQAMPEQCRAMMQNMPQGCMRMMQQMMAEGMRGMMGTQGEAGSMGTSGMMPMMAGRGHMMKVMFAVADTNGDGALSFEEVTLIHKRIFDRVDTNKDGKVTLEELHSFTRE
jgi:EF hand